MIKPVHILLFAASAIAGLSSCSLVNDDLDACRVGVELRFLYDYNLESANAFPSQVHCLTLHVYDSEGRYVSTLTETSGKLADENYRMAVDLAPGTYHAVAYGGIACPEASFAHDALPAPGSHYTEIGMRLKPEHVGTSLHDHFYGTVDFTVADGTVDYQAVDLHMSKTTNNIRILLQQLDGADLDGKDFDFTITDSNSLLDHTNTPVEGTEATTYTQWTSGSVPLADVDDDQAVKPQNRAMTFGSLAYGELSTSRIYERTKPQLTIKYHADGRVIAQIPLHKFLAATKSDGSEWTDQEFLDRGSRWNLTFFLDSNFQWYNVSIIVNGYVVRVNDIEFD